jgi:hypothetical protein
VSAEETAPLTRLCAFANAALGSKSKSSKYKIYVSGLNSLLALNSGEIHHFFGKH